MLDAVSKRVHVTLPDKVFDTLERWADDQGRPVANLVAYLVEKTIEKAETQGRIPSNQEHQQKQSSTSTLEKEEK
jgi:hypothetical protein